MYAGQGSLRSAAGLRELAYPAGDSNVDSLEFATMAHSTTPVAASKPVRPLLREFKISRPAASAGPSSKVPAPEPVASTRPSKRARSSSISDDDTIEASIKKIKIRLWPRGSESADPYNLRRNRRGRRG